MASEASCPPRLRLSPRTRCDMISSLLAQTYFGHVSVGTAAWAELDAYCDKLLALGAQHAAALQRALADALREHPAARFPGRVTSRQKALLVAFSQSVCRALFRG